MDCTGKLNEKLVDDVKCYVDMQVDSAKLAAVEGLSTVTGKAIGLIIFLFLCNVGLFFILAALTYWLGVLINSFPWAAVIMGTFLILVGILVFARPGLFVNKMVAVYSKMFFSPHKNKENEQMQA